MILELDIIHNSDASIRLEELGIEADESDTYLVKWTFYRIDYVVVREKNPEHSVIGVADDQYLTPVPYHKLTAMIKEAMGIKPKFFDPRMDY